MAIETHCFTLGSCFALELPQVLKGKSLLMNRQAARWGLQSLPVATMSAVSPSETAVACASVVDQTNADQAHQPPKAKKRALPPKLDASETAR